jgi:hypothetical protein
MADCCIGMHAQQYLPDPTKFPLLHSLVFALQEIVQLHGSKSICFIRGNSRSGTLVVVPPNWTLLRFKEDFSKPGFWRKLHLV